MIELHKIHKRHRRHLNILTAVLVVVIVSQIYALIYIDKRISNSIDELENKLSEKIDGSNIETQSKMNSISNAINLVSSAQTSLEGELNVLKAETSADFSGIIEREIKGVVTIKTDISQGTGFILTNNGYVITNAHVLVGARMANVYTYDDNIYPADFIGYDGDMDLALLKIKGTFYELKLGNSDDVKIGEKVIAIGNPLGLSFTTTEGIISARDREGSNGLPYYFQTDVSLNPGNSGGPLINTQGEIIGINNFKVSGSEGIGFALEINYVKDTVDKIAGSLNMSIL